jgi:hypothetical protein
MNGYDFERSVVVNMVVTMEHVQCFFQVLRITVLAFPAPD